MLSDSGSVAAGVIVNESPAVITVSSIAIAGGWFMFRLIAHTCSFPELCPGGFATNAARVPSVDTLG